MLTTRLSDEVRASFANNHRITVFATLSVAEPESVLSQWLLISLPHLHVADGISG